MLHKGKAIADINWKWSHEEVWMKLFHSNQEAMKSFQVSLFYSRQYSTAKQISNTSTSSEPEIILEDG